MRLVEFSETLRVSIPLFVSCSCSPISGVQPGESRKILCQSRCAYLRRRNLVIAHLALNTIADVGGR